MHHTDADPDFTLTLAQIGGKNVLRPLCEVREDGRTWLGSHWTEYDWQGKKVSEEVHWTGYFTSQSGSAT